MVNCSSRSPIPRWDLPAGEQPKTLHGQVRKRDIHLSIAAASERHLPSTSGKKKGINCYQTALVFDQELSITRPIRSNSESRLQRPFPFLAFGSISAGQEVRSEEHTLNSSHLVISYAVFCLKK